MPVEALGQPVSFRGSSQLFCGKTKHFCDKFVTKPSRSGASPSLSETKPSLSGTESSRFGAVLSQALSDSSRKVFQRLLTARFLRYKNMEHTRIPASQSKKGHQFLESGAWSATRCLYSDSVEEDKALVLQEREGRQVSCVQGPCRMQPDPPDQPPRTTSRHNHPPKCTLDSKQAANGTSKEARNLRMPPK